MKKLLNTALSICLAGGMGAAFASTSETEERKKYRTSGISYSQFIEQKFKPSLAYTHTQRYSERYRNGHRVFVFDPKALRWYAYHNGRLIKSGRASGGSHYCPDVGRSCRTPVGGHFTIHAKRGANCVSSKYPINRNQPRARMPYCSFFHRGYAIHGSNNVPNHNASHGCIRVHPEAARWLQKNFLYMGTRVIVRPYR